MAAPARRKQIGQRKDGGTCAGSASTDLSSQQKEEACPSQAAAAETGIPGLVLRRRHGAGESCHLLAREGGGEGRSGRRSFISYGGPREGGETHPIARLRKQTHGRRKRETCSFLSNHGIKWEGGGGGPTFSTATEKVKKKDPASYVPRKDQRQGDQQQIDKNFTRGAVCRGEITGGRKKNRL